jgi:hypothetical protein
MMNDRHYYEIFVEDTTCVMYPQLPIDLHFSTVLETL